MQISLNIVAIALALATAAAAAPTYTVFPTRFGVLRTSETLSTHKPSETVVSTKVSGV